MWKEGDALPSGEIAWRSCINLKAVATFDGIFLHQFEGRHNFFAFIWKLSQLLTELLIFRQSLKIMKNAITYFYFLQKFYYKSRMSKKEAGAEKQKFISINFYQGCTKEFLKDLRQWHK